LLESVIPRLFLSLDRIALSPGYDRPSLARPKTRKMTGCVPVGQVKLVLISCPQLSFSPCRKQEAHIVAPFRTTARGRSA
jgi:hypothetical protein